MKILTINCVYNIGSTGKIINDISDCLADRCEFIHCYETGPKTNNSNYLIAGKYERLFYYAFSRITGLKYSTGYTSTMRLIYYIKKKKPDVVHIHCPNINTVNLHWLFAFLKKTNIPTVITNHAEFFYTGNCPHSYDCLKFLTGCGSCSMVFDDYRPYLFDRTAYEWKKMKKSFENFNNIWMIAVSPWVLSRLKISPISKELPAKVIKNGIDTKNIFYYRDNNDVREQLNIEKNQKVLLHVTADFDVIGNNLKGSKYIIEIAQKLKDIKLLVVGPFRIANITIPENILFIGAIHDQQLLAQYYSIADLTVITSRRETFGMVCAESLACGTPVVGFKAGGPESISLDQYSEFVDYPDVEQLIYCINHWIDKKPLIKDSIIEDAQKKYSKEKMAEEYYRVYCDAANSVSL